MKNKMLKRFFSVIHSTLYCTNNVENEYYLVIQFNFYWLIQFCSVIKVCF